ncbi:MAG TPA: hypothetical protein VKU90_16970 [Caulobacteraceae bacterium]|nr:hypothetical protein [Caulobacteraceae bacterium]
MGGVVAEWPQKTVDGFETKVIRFRHSLPERPLFSDEGLVSVFDRYPREALGIYTMGHDLKDWQSWRRGTANGLNGEKLLDAVKDGRLWLNLRHANDHLKDFSDLCDEIAAEKEAHFKTRILNRDLGLLVSSPSAQVFYHLDVPLSSLWQVRGHKQIWFYPRTEPFVEPAWLERCVHATAEGQMPFDPAWDEAAETFTMSPGDMVTWPQNLPHRVDNAPEMSVAVSMEYMTPRARVRANVLHANGVLRERFGWTPQIQDRLGPAMAAKLAVASLHKAWTARRRAAEPILPESFRVETNPA